MHTTSPVRRWIALLPLALQLALPSVVALADARLDAASAAAPIHVESQAAAKACAVLHPENCALCRFLSSPQAHAQSAAVALPAGAVRSIAARQVLLASRVADRRSPPARAPPVLA